MSMTFGKKYVALCLGLLFFSSLVAMGQTREVSGTYRYLADAGQSPKEARAAAVEQARVEVLAKEFGTLITQDVLSQLSDENSYFMQLSTAEVKGEWIKDLEPPVVKFIESTADDIYIYEATVKGLAREIKNEAADFETYALRNGTDKRFVSTDFKPGDKFYLYFKAPFDGYVAAFMINEKHQVFCLLPHEKSPEGLLKVKSGKEYAFFSKNDVDFEYEDGMQVTCDDAHLELDRIYVIFSPAPFVKPVTGVTSSLGHDNLVLPRQLELKDFSQWMSKVYARDNKMGRKVIRIRIRN